MQAIADIVGVRAGTIDETTVLPDEELLTGTVGDSSSQVQIRPGNLVMEIQNRLTSVYLGHDE